MELTTTRSGDVHQELFKRQGSPTSLLFFLGDWQGSPASWTVPFCHGLNFRISKPFQRATGKSSFDPNFQLQTHAGETACYSALVAEVTVEFSEALSVCPSINCASFSFVLAIAKGAVPGPNFMAT